MDVFYQIQQRLVAPKSNYKFIITPFQEIVKNWMKTPFNQLKTIFLNHF